MDNTEHIWSKAYFNTTVLDPVAAMILAAMVIAIFVVPRRYAVWPMIVIACFVTQAQRITLGSADFTFLRILTVFAMIRVAVRGEFAGFKWNGLDYTVIFFMALRTTYAFLHITKNVSLTPMSMCGDTLDAWGQYFFFRCVVRDFDDLRWATYGFMLVAIPNSILFIYEYTSGHNPFFFMGGVSDITRTRDGTVRCMNAYSHPILAGCFWAVLLPYMGATIKQKGRIKIFPLFGILAASIIVLLSGSSSPIAAAGLAFLGGCAFLFRHRIRMIRWVFFLIVVATQLMANSPIWKVFARVHIIGGSTGYYRFKLIDQFIHHWSDWIIAGSASGTANWDMPMFDIVNYYVVLGLGGGLIFILILIAMLVLAYKNAGVGMESAVGNTEDELLAWSTGVSIFAHMMTFLAVTYFGQITMVWYFSLAVTGVVNRNPIRRGFSVLSGWAKDPLSRLAAQRPAAYRQPVRVGHGY